MRGWLILQGKNAKGSHWKRRWFQNSLSDLTQLQYYSDASGSPSCLKGVIDLHSVMALHIGLEQPSVSDRILTGIVLCSDDRMWKLITEGKTEADYWTRGLRHLLNMIDQAQFHPAPFFQSELFRTPTNKPHTPHPNPQIPQSPTNSRHHPSTPM
ncbi:hypothetical protein Pelo_3901 [Pelomyxa schiedti]|nr:hypothetical protein Pelo_3901 [Pelomyxa schiedti]